ncbi:MAG TPA: glycosyl hydrolase-related protein [Candidatus Limnocylindrales bacterium]|nr:glycosyl hydrolase-related protein [Candidatus Limnocylindrales bacterium]
MSIFEPAAPDAAAPATAPATVTARSRLAGLTFAVVPHTHWDREWYPPFEVFRLRLVGVVERVLDALEADPRMVFTLDGQAAIIDDVLELRPDLRERIAQRARAGQLALGPAYVQPDEFLAGAETLVRSLLAGRRVVESLGVEPMAIGYQPDVFGHTAQLPQILRGFGLDGFVAWRGMGDEIDRLGPVFRWVAPDGSWVHAIRQLDGYGAGSMLGRWTERGVQTDGAQAAVEEAVARRFARFVERHEATIARGPLRSLTLANGGDHHEIQPELPSLLDAARAAHPDATFEVTRYDRWLDDVRPALEPLRAMPEAAVHGELLGAREAFIVRGVNSARMPLKLAHERTERGLRTAETLLALSQLSRPETAPGWPREALDYAWRELLRNSPHDSITGCSTDAVHRTMVDRYARADQVTDRVREESMAALVGRHAPWDAERDPADVVSVVNPLPIARRAVVRLPLVPYLAGDAPLVADRPAETIAVQRAAPTATPTPDDAPAGDEAWVAVDLPAWGATTVAPRRGTVHAAGSARVVDDRTIETDDLRVRVGDGMLEVTDRRTGRTWWRVAWLEDVADAGDEYTHRGLDGDEPWTSLGRPARVSIREAGPLVVELEAGWTARLPRRLEPGLTARSRRLVRVPITVRVRLVHGVDVVELEVVVDNRARDHRLRLRFDDPEPADTVRAGSPFAIVRRGPGPRSDGTGWYEIPEPTDHLAGVVAAGSLAVLAPGITEYQAIPNAAGGLDLAITLLRCVGMLGRELPSRMGGAGPAIPTPDAQCPGIHVFRLGIRPVLDSTGRPLSDADLARDALAFATPLEVGPAGTHRAVPLALEGDDLVFSALKAAEDGDGWILRAWNAEARDVRTRVTGPGLRSERCRLDERPLPEDRAADDRVGPFEIATWRIRRSSGGER